MNTQELTNVIDEALERFRGRDLVASAEVQDVLLDLRLLLHQLMQSETGIRSRGNATLVDAVVANFPALRIVGLAPQRLAQNISEPSPAPPNPLQEREEF